MTVPSSISDRPARTVRTADWASVIAGAIVVGCSIVLAAWVLNEGSDGSPSASGSAGLSLSAKDAAAPSVLSKRFVGLALASHDGEVLVGIGAHPGGPVDVVVIPSDQSVVPPKGVRIRVERNSLAGTTGVACGLRCLRFPLRVLGGTPSTLAIAVDRPGKASAQVRLRLPARSPPSADALLRRARARMLDLRSLSTVETLGAGFSPPVVSHWSFQAPDRMRYFIVGGTRAVVIGSRRWDWLDRSWERSSSSKVRIPAYSWQAALEPRLLGRATVGGTQVKVLAARKPGAEFPAWFLLYVTDDGRVLRSRMLSTAHFMIDTYTDFDTAPPIRPPE